MKRLFWMGGALLLVISLSCTRLESDPVLSYAFKDNMAFAGADTSFAAKFDIFWKGMNANYALWDFEKANGVDWDEVYDTYQPKFAALDTQDSLVTDKQLKDIMDEMIAPLHDGHLAIQFYNHDTDNYVMTSPGGLRVSKERYDELIQAASFSPSMNYYQENDEIIETRNIISNTLLTSLPQVALYVRAEQNALSQKPDLTPEEKTRLDNLTALLMELAAVTTKASTGNMKAAISLYNEAVIRYGFMQIPGFVKVDPKLSEYGLNMTYTLFKGNIAYLRFDSFKLTVYLHPEAEEEIWEDASEETKAIVKQVKETWNAWFQAIQDHHKRGDLGGVIIDVRSNTGGMLADYQYVLGALVPSGGIRVMDARFKRGSGRYDYSPVLPQYMPSCEEEHVTVTEPIAVLCNCYSISMAEMTSIGTKVLDNAKLVGTRTWGGLCALSDASSYSNNYAGQIGIQNDTPVFCYIPQEVSISLDGKILEGYGVEPDIEVPFDAATWSRGAGPDNQLDRALSYIRTGK